MFNAVGVKPVEKFYVPYFWQCTVRYVPILYDLKSFLGSVKHVSLLVVV